MDSYIAAPQVHANAVKNPKMLGGPFIDYNGGRVAEIAALRDRTKTERAGLLALSSAVGKLDAMLRTRATGYSLQPLYCEVPEILKGYVELVYDLNDHASFRIIEPLIYNSPFYQPCAQNLMLSLITGDYRPFVLSTPRLDSADSLALNIAFHDERVDVLFRSKTTPQPRSLLREMYEIPERSAALFDSFFGAGPPAPYESYRGGGVRWRYFGHACILVESCGVSVLLDPVLSYTYENNISRYTYLDLPEHLDYILITHNHQDHLLFETLLQLRHKTGTVVVPRNSGGSLQDPSMKLLLNRIGFRNVRELSEMEAIETNAGTILGLPFLGEHADLDVRSKMAYLVKLGKHALLFAADSCNIEPRLYRHIQQIVGDVDALFLGMECDGAPLSWLYGSLLTRNLPRAIDESRRLAGSNYEQAIDLVGQLHCKHVYVYAMGQEPWLNYVMSIKYTEQSRPIVDSSRLIQDCLDRGICAERLFGEREILLQ